MRSKKGITLISLVITVIVLLILAAVAINLAVNSEGLFTKAGEAANKWNSSVAEEEGIITEILQLADELGKEPAINSFYQNGGSIEVKFVDKSNKIIEEPLAPVLGTGMTAVKWNGTEWAETNSADEEWYDYSQSKWANAKTADGSMWVWIPRYAYEMTYTLAPYTSYALGNSSNSTLEQMKQFETYGATVNIEVDETLHEVHVDVSMSGVALGSYTLPAYSVDNEELAKQTGCIEYILYEKNTDGEYTLKGYVADGELSSEKEIVGHSNSKGIVTTEGRVVAKLEAGVETSGKYIVHPAFGTNLDLGGWSEPLAGIWVAKYEMSMEKDGEATTTDSSSIGNVLTTDSIKMVSKPNVSSWIWINISNIYTNCYNYDRTNESHLMKNSEWGAVAYLSYSQYGTNSVEMSVNTSENWTTGTGGVAASSTGNATGIYDLSGGAWEYVATYDKLGGNNLSTYGSSFATGTSTKYSTAYSNGTLETGGKEITLSASKTGDATREMVGSYTRAWNEDTNVGVAVDYCYAIRGGEYGMGANAGVFSASAFYGNEANSRSFRAVLAPALSQT